MLENKIAGITGAARGIDLACAQRLVTERATVLLADVLSDVLDEAGEAAATQLRDDGGRLGLDYLIPVKA